MKKKEKRELMLNMGAVMKGYLIFPAIFGVILLALTVVLFFIYIPTGLVAAAAFVLYVLALIVFFAINNRNLERGLVRFARQYGGLEGEMISDFPMPYVLTDPDGRILAYNKIFGRIYDEKAGIDHITQIFHEVTEEDLHFDAESNNVSVFYDNRDYRLCIRHIKVTKDLIEDKIVLMPRHDMTLCVIYMFDETEIVNMMRKTLAEQMVIGSIYVDNYDEVLSRDLDIQKNIQAAMIDKTIGAYFSNVGGVVRKLERDRYFVIFKRKYLTGLQRNKFELLDQIKELDTDNEHVITISVGIGVGEDYTQAEAASNSALELALGRGGDQVVVKEGERVYFYGGKTKQVEKNTRVKARVKAIALRDVLISKERVVIMGHKNADIDSFASAIGIYRAARSLGKNAFIIVNKGTNTIQPVIEQFLADEEYAMGVFISPEQAEEFVNQNTALVIVDVNRPEIFECPDLVQETPTVVLIDHHLQSGDKIDNLVLSYVEPTASSASEMVTELLQYITDSIGLRKLEAEALYGGIIIDTDSFTRNTGVRTFEAAAYLRKIGIDIQAVHNTFRDTLDTIRVKAAALETAEEIIPGFVAAVSPSGGVFNPTVVAAQVANDLLDIKGVKASFVMTTISGRTYISARSIGDTNVQLVMERMGGGGHLNVAGCQLENTSSDEAKKILAATLRKMLEENSLV
ncbi:MAG: DHH family phosphoesterase [Parasporobacterium sp.]|nr:DHH family phosphoesterase [Parasporobacterium sp.]